MSNNDAKFQARILVVDDAPENIDVLSDILRAEYKVMAATSGEKALQIAQGKSQPDLILLDIKMPGIDGFETCERLKSNNQTSHIPVIFVTADRNIESEERGLNLGAVDYITKPFNPALVKVRVDNHLDLKRHRDNLEALVKERSNALDEAYVQHSLLLDFVSEGIYGLDLEGKVTFANPAACKILGFEYDELLNQSIHTLIQHSYIDGQEYPEDKSPIYKTYTEGLFQQVLDGVFWRRNGNSFPTEYTSTPIFKNDKLIGAVVAFRDISERKKVERLKNEFISTVSHELRTPLTSIKGAVGLMAGGVLGAVPEKMLNLLTTTQDNIERLHFLIDDLLDMGQMESGKLSLNKNPILVKEILHKSIVANKSYADKYYVQLLFQPSDSDNTRINGDINRLTQVLSNLLSNAIKHSTDNGIIRIFTQSDDDHIRISVADLGSGIPNEYQDKIFERFFQVDSSDTRNSGGTGLGLSITKEIVERHNGNISVESIPGEGATFHVVLPILK